MNYLYTLLCIVITYRNLSGKYLPLHHQLENDKIVDTEIFFLSYHNSNIDIYNNYNQTFLITVFSNEITQLSNFMYYELSKFTIREKLSGLFTE